MNIVVSEASVNEKQILKNMFELYRYDCTEFAEIDLDESGIFGYSRFDLYWIEWGRFPFIIRMNGKLVGFAFVRKIAEGKVNYYTIAEFFILKRYRKFGTGKVVAFYLFDRFSGYWEVSQHENNTPAQNFWRKIIKEYTDDKYSEFRKENSEGPTQCFETRK